MNTSSLLRTMVVVDVLLCFASVGAQAVFGWTLPAELADYRHSRSAGSIHLLLLMVTALCAFASWIGLLTFQRFARRLYLATWGLGILLTVWSGPQVLTAPSMVFREMNALVAGIIVGLVYFTDLARRFERPAEGVAPAGTHLGTGRV